MTRRRRLRLRRQPPPCRNGSAALCWVWGPCAREERVVEPLVCRSKATL
jgi:hypothetical protein